MAAVAPAEASKRWRDLATRARVEARAGEQMDRVLLRQAVIRARRAAFPIAGYAPAGAAIALRELADAYAATELPSRITALAPALEAAAVAVDQLLDEPAIEAATEQRRRMGEREEV
ncbi:MAG: hypothetical protein KGL39_43370 [Patescibacteria group bacterium]|nr:hypothetical protein [Patescibacteria group bacterium]